MCIRDRSYTYQSPYYGKSKKAKQQAAKKQTELLYGKTTGENLKGMMMAVSGGIPVSYTHLDVYKRQDL